MNANQKKELDSIYERYAHVDRTFNSMRLLIEITQLYTELCVCAKEMRVKEGETYKIPLSDGSYLLQTFHSTNIVLDSVLEKYDCNGNLQLTLIPNKELEEYDLNPDKLNFLEGLGIGV